jgi:hypothetical protein
MQARRKAGGPLSECARVLQPDMQVFNRAAEE